MNMPLVLLNRRRRGGLTAFSPSTLFALAEPGVWFDPSDTSTLFQDPAGTTPVTAPGNTVGLMLDKSRGLVLGAELVANGTFDSGIADWTAYNGSTLSYVGGRLRSTNSVAFGGVVQSFAVVIGRTYKFQFSLYKGTSSSMRAEVGFSEASPHNYNSGLLTADVVDRSVVFVATHNPTFVTFRSDNADKYIDIDNISVRELAGNHATQATLTARPTYSIEPVGGRRNLLEQTESVDNAYWTRGSILAFGSGSIANAAAAPDGTTTADLITEDTTNNTHNLGAGSGVTASATSAYSISAYFKRANGVRDAYLQINNNVSGTGGAVVGSFDLATGVSTVSVLVAGFTSVTASAVAVGATGWYRCTLSFTTVASTTSLGVFPGIWNAGRSYLGNGTSGILIWGAQLEQSATATPYQRVTTQYDVTEAGVASLGYLYFDGSDDHMVTSTITPATDKAQVFTGVRKLSDAQPRGLLDYGPSWTTYTGSFAIYAPSYLTGGLPAPKYFVAMKGAAGQRETEYATYTAPITNVLSTLFDISEPAASEILMRIDGVVIAPAASGGSAITGNFNNLALQIGRIGTGASANVNLYSLITRFGPTLDAPTIASTEVWVAGKTGITI